MEHGGPMKIEIWTDIICPWCGLGARRLEKALDRFGHAGEVELVHRSFQLDERAPVGTTEKVKDMLAQKKGLPRAQIDALTARVEQLAAAEGLQPYIVGDNRTGNTALAHELAAWATSVGRGPEMWAKLYQAYFGEARSIFDVDALVELAGELGLSRDEARAALTSRRFADQVRAEGREARELGTTGVPFIVIDRRYAIAGAQSVDVMVQALEQAWRERKPAPEVIGSDGAACGPDGCA